MYMAAVHLRLYMRAQLHWYVNEATLSIWIGAPREKCGHCTCSMKSKKVKMDGVEGVKRRGNTQQRNTQMRKNNNLEVAKNSEFKFHLKTDSHFLWSFTVSSFLWHIIPPFVVPPSQPVFFWLFPWSAWYYRWVWTTLQAVCLDGWESRFSHVAMMYVCVCQ